MYTLVCLQCKLLNANEQYAKKQISSALPLWESTNVFCPPKQRTPIVMPIHVCSRSNYLDKLFDVLLQLIYIEENQDHSSTLKNLVIQII